LENEPKNIRKIFSLLIVILLMQLLPAATARAIPSFARQTGLSGSSCHTVFPELTPFGRLFKLGGYVMSKSTKPF
jgi:hypothetical protein